MLVLSAVFLFGESRLVDECTRAVVLVVKVDHGVDVVVEVEREDNEVCGGVGAPYLGCRDVEVQNQGKGLETQKSFY